MDSVVAEHEHSLMSCWTLLIQKLYGMSMGLMMTFWYVLNWIQLIRVSSSSYSFQTENLQPFTHDFPRADIYEILTPDLLHQVIKGAFKDHLVTWVSEYLILEHGEAQANEILDDIDRRLVLSPAPFYSFIIMVNSIAAAPLFSNLRRFPHGRRFKQWTGDDSKALMKVSKRVDLHL